MATPGTSMMLSQAVADLQKGVARMDDHVAANRGDKAMDEMVTLHHSNVGILQMMVMLCDNLAKGTQGANKPLSECRSINNLKIPNKSDFKKLEREVDQRHRSGSRNAMAQVHEEPEQTVGPGQRGAHAAGP